MNNAGAHYGAPINEITMEGFQKLYTLNVLGPLLVLQAVLPYLPTDGTGRIINISSVDATIAVPGQSVYSATKAALDAMTRCWSQELADRATVNSISPGPVRTDMWDLFPDDIKRTLRPWVSAAPLLAVREGKHSPETIKEAAILGGRPAEPDEVAGIVVMLCSSEAAFCTGQVVSANGGMICGTA